MLTKNSCFKCNNNGATIVECYSIIKSSGPFGITLSASKAVWNESKSLTFEEVRIHTDCFTSDYIILDKIADRVIHQVVRIFITYKEVYQSILLSWLVITVYLYTFIVFCPLTYDLWVRYIFSRLHVHNHYWTKIGNIKSGARIVWYLNGPLETFNTLITGMLWHESSECLCISWHTCICICICAHIFIHYICNTWIPHIF
jgi:hypothetical protein